MKLTLVWVFLLALLVLAAVWLLVAQRAPVPALRAPEEVSPARATSASAPIEPARAPSTAASPPTESAADGAVPADTDSGEAISGSVVDLAGQPLPGATITATPAAPPGAGSDWYERHRRTATSAADGSFRVGGLPAGVVYARALAPGFCGTEVGRQEAETGDTGIKLVLEACASISGHVYGPDGQPQAGAEVRVEGVERAPADLKRWPWFERRATTDESGAYALTAVAPGEVQLVAGHADLTEESLTLELKLGEQLNLVDFRLETGLAISGRVIDERGTPIADAEVRSARAERRHWSDSRTTKSDSEGAFTQRGLDPGGYDLSASHPAYHSPASRYNPQVVEAGTAGNELVLQRGGIVRGRVLGPEHEPMAGATVMVGPGLAGGESQANPYSVRFAGTTSSRSAGDGTFEILGVPTGAIGITATMKGFADSAVQRFELTLETPLEEIVIELRAGAALAGKVVDSGAQPLAGAQVLLTEKPDDQQWGGGNFQIVATTESNGSFSIPGLDENKLCQLDARLAGYALRTESARELRTPGSADIVLVMDAAASVRGRVRDSAGQAIAGARIAPETPGFSMGRASPRASDAMTDAEGNFALDGLAAGNWSFTCSHEGHLQGKQAVTLRVGEQREGVDFQLEAGAQLTGVVIDDLGAPVAGVSVMAMGTGARSSRGAASAADGTFTLEGVPPGELQLLVSGRMPPDLVHPRAPQNARAGEHVTIVLSHGLTLIGRVVADDGQPVPEFQGALQKAGDEPAMFRNLKLLSVTTVDGRFEIKGVSQETASLELNARGFALKRVPTPSLPASGSQDLGTIELTAGSTVAGRVLSTDGTGVGDAPLAIVEPGGKPEDTFGGLRPTSMPSSTSQPNGEFTLEHVPPGAFELVATPVGYRAARVPLFLEAGRDLRDVVITVSRGGCIIGLVTDSSGAPRPGRRVTAFRIDAPPGRGGGLHSESTVTSAEGAFQFCGLDQGTYQVWMEVAAPIQTSGGGMVTDQLRRTVIVNAEGEVRADFEIPVLCHVTGRLRGGSVGGQAGELLSLSSSSTSWNAIVADDGTFALDAMPGSYGSRVGRYATGPVEIPAAAAHQLELSLPGGRVTGRVVDGVGAPLAHAAVGLREVSATYGHLNAESEADGSFAIEGVTPGEFSLVAAITGVGQSRAMPVTVSASGNTAVGDIVLQTGVSLTVRIFDEGDRPVSDVRLAFLGERDELATSVSTQPQSEPGVYGVSGLRPGSYRLFAGTAARGTAWLDGVQAGTTSEVTVRFAAPGPPLEFRVYQDGAPLGGARVELLDSSGRSITDASGYFARLSTATNEAGFASWGRMPAGSYQIRITPSGGAPILQELTIPPGSATAPLQVRIDV